MGRPHWNVYSSQYHSRYALCCNYRHSYTLHPSTCQAYDGAANMQGKCNGLSIKIRNQVPPALPVPSLAHSLNLCLQDAARCLPFLRDALDSVHELAKLIKLSPKRNHMLLDNLKTPKRISSPSALSLPSSTRLGPLLCKEAEVHAFLCNFGDKLHSEWAKIALATHVQLHSPALAITPKLLSKACDYLY